MRRVGIESGERVRIPDTEPKTLGLAFSARADRATKFAALLIYLNFCKVELVLLLCFLAHLWHENRLGPSFRN